MSSEIYNRIITGAEYDAHEAELQAEEDENEEARRVGEAALRRLVDIAENHHSGQSKIIAQMLANTFNGQEFHFNLNDLGRLQTSILKDVLAVIRMDSRPEKETYQYIQNGDARFISIFQKFELVNLSRRLKPKK